MKKTAVVIGATGNLGSAIVAALEKAGYEIDPTWRNANHPDATIPASYKNLPSRIDMAVYTPGINLVKPTTDITDEEWDNVMKVNVTGAFYFARAAYPGLRAAGGTFVAVSSMNSLIPYPGRLAYTTSKSALEGLVRELAIEWGKDGVSTHGIRLGPLDKLMKSTNVNPALLEATKKRMPQGKLIPAEAVADYIVGLGAGTAPWVTGAMIDFDGGFPRNTYPLL